jgi:hypothetical protein
MNWRALKNNECPSCGGELREADGLGLIKCEEFGSTCSFSVYEERLSEILDGMDTDDDYAPYGERDKSW